MKAEQVKSSQITAKIQMSSFVKLIAIEELKFDQFQNTCEKKAKVELLGPSAFGFPEFEKTEFEFFEFSFLEFEKAEFGKPNLGFRDVTIWHRIPYLKIILSSIQTYLLLTTVRMDLIKLAIFDLTLGYSPKS